MFRAIKKFLGQEEASSQRPVNLKAVPMKPAIRLVSSVAQVESKPQPVNDDAHIKRIESVMDLPLFKAGLSNRVGIANEWVARIYPILVDESKKLFALVLHEQDFKTDMFDTIKKKILENGYHPASIWIYFAPPGVALSLSRKGAEIVKSLNNRAEKSSSSYYVMFERMARFAFENKASDLHLEINLEAEFSVVRFAIDDKILPITEYKTPSTELLTCVAYMYNNHGVGVSQTVFNQNISQGCNIPFEINRVQLEFRFASQPAVNGLLVVMRVAESYRTKKTKFTYESMGYLPDQIPQFRSAMSRPKGGIIFCGRVGSGKTTVQYCALAEVDPYKTVITLEDPVENRLPNATQIEVSRALHDEGDNYDPFQAATRQLKRLNPKVVAAGEIRDNVTAEVFKDAVESGVLTLGTIHCGSVVEALTMRLVGKQLGIGREVISTPEFIVLIVFQALVRTLCDHCKLPAEEVYDDEYLSKIERFFEGLDRKTIKAANRKGCKHCARPYTDALNGLGERTVVAEMLRPDYGMLRLVREAKNIEIAQRFNMMRGNATFADPETTGKTALEVAMYHVSQGRMDPKEVESQLGSFDDYMITKLGQINV